MPRKTTNEKKVCDITRSCDQAIRQTLSSFPFIAGAVHKSIEFIAILGEQIEMYAIP